MTDTPETPPPAPTPSALRFALRKFGLVTALFVVVWLVFGQLLPRVMFSTPSPDAAAPEVKSEPSAVDAPAPTQEAPLPDLTPPAPPPPAPAPPIEEEETLPVGDAATSGPSLAMLEAKISALETLVTQTTATQNDSRSELVENLQAQLIEQRIHTEELAAHLKQMEQRLEQKFTRERLLMQLEKTLQQGVPFDGYLRALRPLVRDNAPALAAIDTLQTYAAFGIPRLETLQQDFARAIPALVAAEHSGVMGALSSVVTVRKVGEVQGEDPQSRIARAESALARADVARALSEMDSFNVPTNQDLERWRNHAHAYVNSAKAFEDLQLALTPAPAP